MRWAEGARRHRAEPHVERPSAGSAPRWHATAGSAERARYLFRDGRGSDGADPPNDWQSQFGGPAWTRVRRDRRPPGPVVPAPVRSPSSRTWTGRTPRCVPSSSRSCGSGSTAASTGSASTSPTGWPRIPRLPDIGERFIADGLVLAGHPHWDRDEVHDVYRAWRTVSGRVRRRSDVRRRGLSPEPGTPGAVRPARRAAHRVQLPVPARSLGCRRAADRHRREHRGDA